MASNGSGPTNYKRVFERMDKDGSGSVDTYEFVQGLKSLG